MTERRRGHAVRGGCETVKGLHCEWGVAASEMSDGESRS